MLKPHFLLIALCFAAVALPKDLTPVLSPEQTLYVNGRKIKFACETKNGIQADVAVFKDKLVFYAYITVENKGAKPIAIEQEKFFVLNTYDKELRRITDRELRRYYSAVASLPPPPKSEKRDLKIEPDGSGGFDVHESRSFDAAVDDFGAAWGAWNDRRRARKEIERLDKMYFRDTTIQPGETATGEVRYYAENVSDKTPITVVLQIEKTSFVFRLKE